MQLFKDSVTGRLFHFDDDVVVGQDAGKYIFTAAHGELLNVPDTLQPHVLTEAETLARMADEKNAVIAQMRILRAGVLNALAGIAGRAQRAGNSADANACDAASAALLDITLDPGVVAATDGATTTAAVLACYRAIAAQLTANSPASVSAFDSLELTL